MVLWWHLIVIQTYLEFQNFEGLVVFEFDWVWLGWMERWLAQIPDIKVSRSLGKYFAIWSPHYSVN